MHVDITSNKKLNILQKYSHFLKCSMIFFLENNEKKEVGNKFLLLSFGQIIKKYVMVQ